MKYYIGDIAYNNYVYFYLLKWKIKIKTNNEVINLLRSF